MHDIVNRETGEVVGERPGDKIAPEVAAAIVAVKKRIKQLGSDEKNTHAGYGYVSVDKFYAAIGPLMAEAGLLLLVDEVSTEVREGAKGNPWLFARYEMRFAHESGVLGPIMRRSCALPIAGPQAFGAAQSYVEKQLLRQVFKVPTGDKDADAEAPQEGAAPTKRLAPLASSATGARPQAAQPGPEDDDLTKRFVEIRNEIDISVNLTELEMVEKMPAWQALFDKLHAARGLAVAHETIETLRRRIERRAAMLRGEE